MANGVLGRWCGALILVPLLMRWLPESAVFAGENSLRHHCVPYLRQKRQPRRAAVVVLFLHSAGGLHVDQLAPLLLVEQGFQPSQAAGVMFACKWGRQAGR